MPKNTLFNELVERNLVVRDGKGNLPSEDAVLDFSNPAAVEWYQGKLANLLGMGVGAIKADFGEAARANGVYASGRTGFYEHNLYPLRYNKAVADITKKTTGENIIWARSAWAGSQRYPLHWGGDAESTDQGMAAELRGGLSFGLCGFSFWSHDVGGFTARADDSLYLRWLSFGALTSHTRCHGVSPKEPWEYGDKVMAQFRKIDEMKYKLMPYVYAQAKDCSERGLPMLRALFVEYPDDPGSWLIDSEYLFGSDMLVAPLFEDAASRSVYLPPGKWIDYQSGRVYAAGWSQIQAGEIPAVILVRDGDRPSAHQAGAIDGGHGLVEPGVARLRGGQQERAGPGMPAFRPQAEPADAGSAGRSVPPDRRSALRQSHMDNPFGKMTASTRCSISSTRSSTVLEEKEIFHEEPRC